MNGNFTRTPNYTTEQFTLNIHHDITALIKAGISNEARTDFVLPFYFHPFHREHTNSYCLQVGTGHDSRIVIPVIELIRFYFGSSSNLVARLFHAPFREDAFWTSATKDEHGFAHVGLADGLSGYSAADVARVALNTTARHAAKLISDSCVAASVAREKVYPKTFFPFTGETNLKVSGIWIEQPGSSWRTFLVFKILTCSHPFPFASLGYTMERKHFAATSGNGEEGTQGERLWKLRKESRKPLDNNEPSRSLGKKTVKLSHFVRFPDLLHKDVRRTDPGTPATVLCADISAEVDAWSVGEGGSTSGTRPVDFVDARDAPAPKSHPASEGIWWSVVSALVDKLMLQYPEIQFIPLDGRQRYPQISTMPQMVNGDGEIHPMCLIQDKGHARHRHVAIIRYADNGNAGVLIFPEIEEENGKCQERATLFLAPVEVETQIDGRWLLGMLSCMLWGGTAVEVLAFEKDMRGSDDEEKVVRFLTATDNLKKGGYSEHR